MTALAIGSATLVALLAILVVGLWRSYGAVLVRLEQLERAPRASTGSAQIAASLPAPSDLPTGARGVSVVGVGLAGDAVQVTLEPGAQNTLLAFMTSGCTTCVGFWRALQPENKPSLPIEARVVIVTKDASFESPSRLQELGAANLMVVQSSAAWDDYAVPGSPYFVYVDGATATVTGEGTALAWDQVESLLRDAVLDSAAAAAASSEEGQPSSQPRGETGAQRAQRAEDELRTAGVAFDDPSFYGLTPHEQASLQE